MKYREPLDNVKMEIHVDVWKMSWDGHANYHLELYDSSQGTS